MPAVERTVADALGPELISSVRERVDGPRVELAPSGLDADALAGPDGLTHMANTFSRNDVIIAVARSAPQGMHAANVLDQTNHFLAREDIIHLDGDRYTSTDLLEAETAREWAQLSRADAGVGLATERALQRGTRGLGLNREQRAVVEAVFRSGNGVDIVEAQAGTGKTYTAEAIRRVAEQDGRRVIGTAPTARAARELHGQAGIESYTVDSLLRQLDRGQVDLTWKDVLVVDEAGMLATRPGARLEQHAAAGAKSSRSATIASFSPCSPATSSGSARGARRPPPGLSTTRISSFATATAAKLCACTGSAWMSSSTAATGATSRAATSSRATCGSGTRAPSTPTRGSPSSEPSSRGDRTSSTPSRPTSPRPGRATERTSTRWPQTRPRRSRPDSRRQGHRRRAHPPSAPRPGARRARSSRIRCSPLAPSILVSHRRSRRSAYELGSAAHHGEHYPTRSIASGGCALAPRRARLVCHRWWVRPRADPLRRGPRGGRGSARGSRTRL